MKYEMLMHGMRAVAVAIAPYVGEVVALERARNGATPFAMPLPDGVTAFDVWAATLRAFPEPLTRVAHAAWIEATSEVTHLEHFAALVGAGVGPELAGRTLRDSEVPS